MDLRTELPFFISYCSGYLDTVTGNGSITLLKAKANGLKSVKLFGGCEQNGTPTPTTPVNIVSNNGAIKYSANMCNVNAQTALVGYYISTQGVVTADTNNWIYQAFIPVKPNTTYTLSMSSAVYFASISEYSTADDSGFIVRNASGSGAHTQFTITTGANTNFVRFGTNIDRTEVTLEEVLAINWMLNEGGTAIPYAPYTESGIYTDGTLETVQDNLSNTATAEMLLAIGDTKDTQEILSGSVTRNIGVKVLDGTENWTMGGTYNQFYTDDTITDRLLRQPGICSHYAYTTNSADLGTIDNVMFLGVSTQRVNFAKGSFESLVDFKQFLTDQYNAGTPVIIVYQLSEPTTETVTGQTLQTQAGTNILQITQASIDNLPLEATYKKSR